ncbi:hypothetical protein SGFS_104330 [Streptomyces graminofaciens]|uniref:PPM-type phosphatase domain-containing protein n=1 Tax=Streptomyces graminofaciens TaxID=68212 RepID=A0ABN5W0A3_9ACTN|nr:hypothetical protein SGFS_104330 [Streptomyces graminofaciens]
MTIQALADRAALSIESARRYSYEHTMALELQRALLSEPRTPHPAVEVAARYIPSGRSVLVGGDWYDSIPLTDSRTLLVMGDVMGHGFQAAVAMSQYRSLLRTIAASGTSVDKILGEFDRQVAQLGLDRLATCLLAIMDPRAGTCTAASAGHLPPAALRPDGSIEIVWLPAGPPSAPDSEATNRSPYEWTTAPRCCSTPTGWWNAAVLTSTSRCKRLSR